MITNNRIEEIENEIGRTAAAVGHLTLGPEHEAGTSTEKRTLETVDPATNTSADSRLKKLGICAWQSLIECDITPPGSVVENLI